MPCAVHPDRETVASCVVCGNLNCEGCDVVMAGKHYCRHCLAQAERMPAGAGRPAAAGSPRRLTRSTRDRMLAGVCGGMAAYGGLDPVLVRVLYAVITLLTGIVLGLIAYFVMAMLVPNEDTTS